MEIVDTLLYTHKIIKIESLFYCHLTDVILITIISIISSDNTLLHTISSDFPIRQLHDSQIPSLKLNICIVLKQIIG